VSNPKPIPLKTEFNNPYVSRKLIVLAIKARLANVKTITILPYAVKEKSVEERFKVFSTITPATMHMDATVIGKINRQTSGGANDEMGFFDFIRWSFPLV
jgi:hypothetical protein